MRVSKYTSTKDRWELDIIYSWTRSTLLDYGELLQLHFPLSDAINNDSVMSLESVNTHFPPFSEFIITIEEGECYVSHVVYCIFRALASSDRH